MTLKAYITKRDRGARDQTTDFFSDMGQMGSGAPDRGRLRFRQVRVFIVTLPPFGKTGLRCQVTFDGIRTNYQRFRVIKRTLTNTIITYLEGASCKIYKGSRVSPFPGLPRKTPCALEGR